METLPPAGEKRVWGFWATAGFGAVVLVVTFIIQAIISGVLVLIYLMPELDLTSGAINPEEIITMSTGIVNAHLGQIVTLSVFAEAVFGGGLVLLLIKARKRAGIIEYLGFRQIGKLMIVVALAVTVGYLAFEILTNWLLGMPEDEIMLEMYQTSVWLVPLWIGVVVIGPIFEEVLFRGFMLEGFRQSIGSFWAIVITSAVFAVLHLQYDLLAMGQIFILGFVLGLLRVRTNSLWSSIIVHILNNLVAMVLVALTAEGILT